MKKSNPTRVLMVVPKYPQPVVGGLEKQAFELSRTLALNQSVEVSVLSAAFDPSHEKQDTVEGISIIRLRWSNNKWFKFAVLPFQIANVIWKAKKKIDVVHVHQYSAFGLFAIAVSRILSLPVMVKLPNVGDYGIPGIKKGLFGWLAIAVFLRANAFVAMSNESINELVQAGVPRSRILTIPNGIVLSQQVPCIRKPNTKSTTSPCRVVFVGRISKEKRLDVLLKAWQLLQSGKYNIAILEIWGDGPLRTELEQWCHTHGLLDSIHWLGKISDVRSKLAEVDVFVLPSSHEGNSNAILEAMDAGVPIVATPVGGTQMQLGEIGAPYLVPVGDAHALAEQLLLLINDPQLRRNYGNGLHYRVLKYFDMEQIANGYMCAYQRLGTSSKANLANCARLPTI